ncbi:helix-turn-helix transcriptional regulator [bacterium]|nr:helix-turn-helix transcriptional regulator [bacterium]
MHIISNIENARYDIPLSRVRLIAKALQVDIKDFFNFKQY